MAFRGLDRILSVLAGDARARVDDPVTALRVRLIGTPPLVLVRRCIAGDLVERAANTLEVRAGEILCHLLGYDSDLRTRVASFMSVT